MIDNVFTHTPTSENVLTKIRAALPSFISEKRLLHTLSVEKEALRLAELLFDYLGISKEYYTDISAAALLHDITKYYPLEKHLEICNSNGIPIDENSRSNTAVLHSRTGAVVARQEFGINDTVFSAIFCHTTGKEDMNVFDKIIFIADYIEETRTHKSCKEARAFFYDSLSKESDIIKILDMTILMSLDATLSYLEESGSYIDSQTIKARDFLLAEYALLARRTGVKK